MSRPVRALIVTASVVAGFWLGAITECWYFFDPTGGGCIPLIGGTLGAVVGGIVASPLTDPRRRRKTYEDPETEAAISERQRRWKSGDD